ncbi:MAG: YdcF family protein [Litorilinea sp.]
MTVDSAPVRRRVTARGCLLIWLALHGVGVLVLLVLGLNLGRWLDATARPAQVDAIVVLGGEGGRFPRTAHALALYHDGVAPVVVFSGGTLLSAGIACSSTALSVEAAHALGLPAAAIRVAGEAQSTFDEAVNVRILAQDAGWDSLVIVTDRFHTRRALQTFRAYFPEIQLFADAPADPVYDADRWWDNERSLIFAVNEAIKLGFYWLRYGIAPA